MTRTFHRDRLWAIAGVLAAVVLAVLGWFFLVSPQNAETSDLEERAAAAQHKVVALQRRLDELRAQNQELPRYKEQLARDRAALPTTASTSDLLRNVQTAGEQAGVTVGAISIGAANQSVAAGTFIYVLPISVSTQGNPDQLGRFLDQLQQVQPRAALITNANLGPESSRFTLTLAFNVFVAGGPAPAASAAGSTGTPGSGG